MAAGDGRPVRGPVGCRAGRLALRAVRGWSAAEGPGCQSCVSLQETQQIPTEEVVLEVLLSNGQKVKVTILTSDQTEDVLEVPELLCWAGPAPSAEFCGFPHVQESPQPGSPPALPALSLPQSKVVLGG